MPRPDLAERIGATLPEEHGGSARHKPWRIRDRFRWFADDLPDGAIGWLYWHVGKWPAADAYMVAVLAERFPDAGCICVEPTMASEALYAEAERVLVQQGAPHAA